MHHQMHSIPLEQDGRLADVARSIINNPAVREDRLENSGGNEFFGLMEKLAGGGGVLETTDARQDSMNMTGQIAHDEVIDDPYMPSVIMPTFNDDGTLHRAHQSLAPRPTSQTAATPITSSWTTAFDQVESEYTSTHTRNVHSERKAMVDGFNVPANLTEALSGVSSTSVADQAWEESLDLDEAGFAEFYGRSWKPPLVPELTPSPDEKWRSRERARQGGAIREGNDTLVESIRAATFGVTEAQQRAQYEDSLEMLEYLERAKTWKEDEGSGYVRGQGRSRVRNMYVFHKENPYLEGMRGRVGDMAGERLMEVESAEESEYRVSVQLGEGYVVWNLKPEPDIVSSAERSRKRGRCFEQSDERAGMV